MPASAGCPAASRLQRRLTELLGAGVVGGPSWRRDRQFFMRRTAEQEHAVLLDRRPRRHRADLVDPVALDPTGTTTLDAWQPSKEGDLLAYQLSAGGTEESELLRHGRRDAATVVDGPIDRTRYSPVAWLPGAEAFYYVRRLAPDGVPAGRAAVPPPGLAAPASAPTRSEDVLVFGEGLDKTNYYGVSVSMDGRWLSIGASAGTAPRNDLWLADLALSSPEAPELRVVQQGVDASTSLHVGRDGRAYLFTDRDSPARPARGDTPDDHVVRRLDRPRARGRRGGARGLRDPRRHRARGPGAALHVDPARGGRGHRARPAHRTDGPAPCPLPGLGSVGGLSERPEGGHEAWLGYTDHVTPSSVYRYDATTGETSLWATAPGTVEVPEVHARQVEYTSADGTTVRMVVVAPTKEPDRPRPTVLYGYGGFGVPLTPGYSAGVLAWVEAGGVYAIANLRGGSEEGEDWHRAGMREHKQNVFDDFHAAAERLVADGWTTPEQLAISGGSNGGLLVGAAMTQRPELYAAVVCSAPLLDMVRYEQFGLGETWNDEYGTARRPRGARLAARAIRRTTTCARASTIRRRCSPSSTATPASTRCTRARCAPPCSTRPAGTGRSCCGARRTSVTVRAR